MSRNRTQEARLGVIVGLVLALAATPAAASETSAPADAHLADVGAPCGDCGAGQCVVVRLYCDENDDTELQPTEVVPAGSVIVLEVQDHGEYETDGFFCSTAPTLTYRTKRGMIIGPWQSAATDASLDVRVADVRMSLRIDGIEVPPTDTARVEITDLGITANGDTFQVPLDTCLVYRRIRDSDTTAWSTCPDKTFSGEGTCGDWVVNFDDLGD